MDSNMDSNFVPCNLLSTSRLASAALAMVFFVCLERPATAGIPFTIKATFENPTSPGEMSLLSLLPDGTILAQTPFVNGAPKGTIFKIDQDGQILASADLSRYTETFSRDPATNHFFFAEPTYFSSTPQFHQFDSDLNAVTIKPMPAGYFGAGAASFSYAFLSDGSDIKFVQSGGKKTLFVLDPEKNLVLERQMNSYVELQRTGDDRFLSVGEVAGHSELTTFDHAGQVLLTRSLPERACAFVSVIDQKYPEEAALVCDGGAVVQLDRSGQILGRYQIDPLLKNCGRSVRAKLVACQSGFFSPAQHRVDLWSSDDWTLVKRFEAPTLDSVNFVRDGLILSYSDRDYEVLDSALQVRLKIPRSANGDYLWLQHASSGRSVLSTRYTQDGWMFQINSLVDGSVEFDLEAYQRAAGLTMEFFSPLKLSDDLYAVAFWCTMEARQNGQCSKGRILILGR